MYYVLLYARLNFPRYVIKKTSLPHIAILGCVTDTGKYKDISLFRNATPVPGVILVRIEESLYFANIGKIREMFLRIEQFGDTKEISNAPKGPPLQAIVIDGRNIQEMDASAVQTMCEMAVDYRERNVTVCFVKLRDSLKNLFLKAGITDLVGGKGMFFTRVTLAMQWLQNDQDHIRNDDGTRGFFTGDQPNNTTAASTALEQAENGGEKPFNENNGEAGWDEMATEEQPKFVHIED